MIRVQTLTLLVDAIESESDCAAATGSKWDGLTSNH